MSKPTLHEIKTREAVLNDRLAIERTKMANDRTILSFIRTSLYFSIAGFSFNEFIKGSQGNFVGILLFSLAFIILLIGIWRYVMVGRKIHKSIRQVRGYAKIMDEE